MLKEIHSYILRRSQLMLRYCNTCNIIIEKGGNFFKSVSLDEKRKWSYMFTMHSINYWKFWYLWLDEQCLVPLFMVILYIQTSSKGLCLNRCRFWTNHFLQEIFDCSIRWWMLTYWWLTMHFLRPHQRNLLPWNKRYCLISDAH